MKKKLTILLAASVLSACYLTACGTDPEPTTQAIEQVYVNTLNNAKDAVDTVNQQNQNIDNQVDNLMNSN